jgi:glycolate oxidase iron-sulfur subunit
VRGLLPSRLREKVPPRQAAGNWPTRTHARKVLVLAGCVQPAMMPNINTATARVLDAAGIQAVVAAKAGCCGALKFHLNDQDGGRAQMRRNIDAWWPFVERGEVEAIVMNASGCGVTVREYGHHLQHDPVYAAKAARISELTCDLSELLPDLVPALKDKVRPQAGVFAYHPPCTLQHGQKLRGGVEQGLAALGFTVRVAINESHLCCGSAGTYSVLHPDIAHTLRDRKLGHLDALQPQAILSANIGCIQHLQGGTALPVRHWIEVLDAALAPVTFP